MSRRFQCRGGGNLLKLKTNLKDFALSRRTNRQRATNLRCNRGDQLSEPSCHTVERRQRSYLLAESRIVYLLVLGSPSPSRPPTHLSAPTLRSLHSPQGPSFMRRRSCALSATMIVERFIAIAPTLMGRLTPHRINIPAAAGMAITL